MPKKKTELTFETPKIGVASNFPVTIEPFTETIQKSGLDLTKAEKYALGYAPLMREVTEQAALLKPLDKTNPDDAAKAKRISLDLGKICSKLTAKKKEDKDTLLIETRLIDGLFNVAESTARLTQKEADEIVDYLAGLERERLAKLADERRAELESYGADTSYLPLDVMGDEQYARCLESAKYAHEARLAAAEKAEQERIAAEQAAVEAEKERQRLEAERIEAERLEAERVKAELAAREAELAEERRIAAEKQAELEWAAKIEREKAEVEIEKLRKKNEAKLAEQKLLADIEAKKQVDIAAEQKRKADAELAKQRAEAEKLIAELQAKKDAEAKAEAERKAAALAPDKDKINQLYKTLKNLEIPDFTSVECQLIGTEVVNKISHILSYIKTEAQKLN